MSKIVVARWDQELSNDETITVLKDLAMGTAENSGRFADALCSAITAGRLPDLLRLDVRYNESDNVFHLVNLRQTLGFFQKWENLDLGVDKEAEAYRKFKQSEDACRLTNIRFQLLEAVSDTALHSVLYRAQRKISRILGDVPKLAEMQLKFGPGATTTVKSGECSPRHKFSGVLACSSELASSVGTLLAHAPIWALQLAIPADAEDTDHWDCFDDRKQLIEERGFMVVPYEVHPGKLQFVPKNAKTYRSIVVEPILNTFFQKGLGTAIKRRLRKAGLDISTQQERNRQAALRGSITGSVATIDLSSASDTISRELVAHLLPYDWFSLLSTARTGKVVYKKETIVLEKFSSMGNAFTFELETLIFWCLTRAVVEELQLSQNGRVFAYGDDIICPTEAVPLLYKVLEFCGFSINTEKSFTSGPFRESCGGDYFLGFDIKPFYVRENLSGSTLFSMHNYFVRHLDFEMARRVLEYIAEPLRIYGPDGFGDGHLIGSWDPKESNKLRKYEERGWSGSFFDTYSYSRIRNTRGFHAPSKTFCLPGDHVVPVYSVYTSNDCDRDLFDESPISDPLVVRGKQGYRRVTIYTLQPYVFRRV